MQTQDPNPKTSGQNPRTDLLGIGIVQQDLPFCLAFLWGLGFGSILVVLVVFNFTRHTRIYQALGWKHKLQLT